MDFLGTLYKQLGVITGAFNPDWDIDYFTYPIDFTPLAASATSTGSFLVQADSAFVICSSTMTLSDTSDVYIANISDNPKYVPIIATMSDSGAGRNLSSGNVSVGNIFGTAQRPFIWPTPKFLDPSSNFAVTLQNLVATAYRVKLAFHGYKVFGDVAKYKNQFKRMLV